MAFAVKRIDHIQLAAPKGAEQEARKFFSDRLGLEEVEKPESLKGRGGVWFRLANQQLHIGIEEPFSPATKAHPAFEVENIEELKLHLKQQAISFIVDEKLPHADRIYLNDPFGNRLEFLEWQK